MCENCLPNKELNVLMDDKIRQEDSACNQDS